MNNMEIFKNNEFGSIRIIKEGEKLLFGAKDVATALGYKDSINAIKRHCKGVAKRHLLTNGGRQELSFIPEGDVYRLIVHSKLPSAERFEKWVFEEVLPCIRKHGAYMTDAVLGQAMADPAVLDILAQGILAERVKNNRLAAENAALTEKAAYFDAFVALDGCTNLRTTAKELGIPERRFCRFLREAGFLYRSPAGNLMPYAIKKNKGLFRVRDYCRNGHTGAYTLVTPQGKQLFRSLLTDCNHEM